MYMGTFVHSKLKLLKIKGLLRFFRLFVMCPTPVTLFFPKKNYHG